MSGNASSVVTGPSASLTANKVFAWKFDVEFLLEKAQHELYRSMTEHYDLFFGHAFNLFVTTHAIADNMWHSKAKSSRKWKGDKEYIAWCKGQNDMVSLFIEFSNTYKHTHRKNWTPNTNLSLRIFDNESVNQMNHEERRNYFTVLHEGSPLVPVINANLQRPIYYRYAADTVIRWWADHSSDFDHQVASLPRV